MNYKIAYVDIKDLVPADYNPRKWSDQQLADLKESLKHFGFVDPAIVNSNESRKNIIIGAHMRVVAAKELGIEKVPVVYVDIADINKEKELNLRLNKNTGEFDFKLLAEFDEKFLAEVGFNSEELDDVFNIETKPEQFDIEKELKKLEIREIKINEGDVLDLDGSRLMCGNSTVGADVTKLMNGEKADLCLTDPPYILDYLNAKRHGKPTEGFGAKKNRKYIGTDELPDNFTELWMANIAAIQKDDFSIIVYEAWKNIRTIWNEMEKYWKVKNMIVWHLPNRNQGYAATHKFFSKYDIAMVGASPNSDIEYNMEAEEDGLQNEYETALYAISGKPQWEGYAKGKKVQPTDFIEFNAADEKSSGQGIIFGTKPLEILIPYIKVLTKRGDLIVEPFGGSGSTLIAATKMKRRCYIMEKCPIYAEVIRNRWEKSTGKKARLIEEAK